MAASSSLAGRLHAAVNKLAKWRTAFAGWQLGTRPKGDAESDAVRDHREATIILRAEMNALTKILRDKHIFTEAEFAETLIDEAAFLDSSYEQKFPGFKSADDGMIINPADAVRTTKGWRP